VVVVVLCQDWQLPQLMGVLAAADVLAQAGLVILLLFHQAKETMAEMAQQHRPVLVAVAVAAHQPLEQTGQEPQVVMALRARHRLFLVLL
jgi:hypothetical protein